MNKNKKNGLNIVVLFECSVLLDISFRDGAEHVFFIQIIVFLGVFFMLIKIKCIYQIRIRLKCPTSAKRIL